MQYENFPEIASNLISSLVNSLLTSLDSNVLILFLLNNLI